MARLALGAASAAFILVTLALLPATALGASPVNQSAPVLTATDPNNLGVDGPGLDCSNGTWDQGMLNFHYQWFANGGMPLGVPDSNHYTPVPENAGQVITCTVAADNGVDPPTTSPASNGITLTAHVPQVIAGPTVSPQQVHAGDSAHCDITFDDPDTGGMPVYTYAYEWRVGGVLQMGQSGPDFTTPTNAAGQDLTCRATATNGSGQAQASTTSMTSPPAIIVPPLPTLTYSRFGHLITGTVPAQSGISVTVSLIRGAVTVASAGPNPVNPMDGTWNADLGAGHGIADPFDKLVVHFTGMGAPPDLIVGGDFLPPWPVLPDSGSVNFDGTIVFLTCYTCDQVSGLYTHAFSIFPLDFGGSIPPNFGASLNPPASGDDLIELTPRYIGFASNMVDELGKSIVTTIAPVPGSSSLPTCSADLVTGSISCSGLRPAATYRVVVNHSGGMPVTNELVATNGGSVFTTSPTLASGDTVNLINGPASDANGRLLSTLHVGTLRVDQGPGGTTTGGDCSPGLWLSDSSFGKACSLAGTVPASNEELLSEEDDLSGGQTTISPTVLSAWTPLPGESIYGTSFHFYVQTAGADPAPVVAAVMNKVGGGQVTIPSIDLTNGTVASGLSPGQWTITFTTTDKHGDTTHVQSRFYVQEGAVGPQGETGATGASGTPGSTGAPGPQGPAGSIGSVGPKGDTGPRGPAGPVGKIKCKLKGKKVTCVIVQASRVRISARLARHGRTVAFGKARRGKLRMHARHALRRGRYVLTLVVRGSGKPVTVHRVVRLR